MKLAIQYLNDAQGHVQAVQIPVADWEKIVQKIKKYEQIFTMRSGLSDALNEVEKMRKGKVKKQSLSDFLNEI
ncbi:MAG: hypothetical protein V4642_13510 [Bacteroidota bacterium]